MESVFRTLVLTAVFCVLAAGCSKKAADPLESAIGTYALRGQEGEWDIYAVEKIDSTSFRDEFERRRNVFEVKLREETRLYDSYVAQNKKKNAARHADAIKKTNGLLKALDSLKATMEDRLDETAYYDYVFSGRVTAGGRVTEFKDAYVSVTPDLEIISMTADRKDLHKTGGRAIPGYMEMLGTSEEDGE